VDEWLFSTTPADVRQGLPPFRTPKFFRPLSTWVNALIDAGLAPERFDESCASEDLVRHFPDFAGCRLVPLWLNVRCRKPVGGGPGPALEGPHPELLVEQFVQVQADPHGSSVTGR
jgi:hypothetical protein